MTKLKTPLLSLEAHGSIGDSLTFQRRQGVNFSREKPRLPYFMTLPVRYQRWLYQDYAYLWRQQTLSVRQAYASSGSRVHLTGYQYWMRYQLTNLPDIVIYWKLDEGAGAIAYDSSRNGNNGGIVGATPIVGTIDGAYYFDGLNDVIWITHNPALTPSTEITLELFMRPTRLNFGTKQVIVSKHHTSYEITIRQNAAHIEAFLWLQGVVKTLISPPNSLVSGETHHITLRSRDKDHILSINGVTAASNAGWLWPLGTNTKQFELGRRSEAGFWYQGDADQCIVYNRFLDDTEVLRHAERRYPA